MPDQHLKTMNDIQFGIGVMDGSECVSTAWELIKKRYGLYLGVTLLTLVITQWLYCISWLLIGPVSAGLYLIVSKDLNDEPIEFGMMFKGFEKFVPLMAIGAVQSIPMIIQQFVGLFFNFASIFMPQRGGIGDEQFFQPDFSPELASGLIGFMFIIFAALFIFWIVWAVVFYFVVPLTLEYDLGLVETIKLSARAAWANLGGIVVLFIMTILVSLLGMLMLCVGIFLVSIPVTLVAYAVAYRQVFPYVRPREFNINPPPPSAYGFGGGNYA